jgi:hypothetical protein
MNGWTKVALLLALVGCGSSGAATDGGAGTGGTAHGGGGGSSGGAGPDGGGGGNGGAGRDGGTDAGGALSTMTWKENGVLRIATSTLANRYISSALDSLSLVGADFPHGATVSIAVGMGGGTALAGTYACGVLLDGGPASAALTYDNRPAPPGETCSVTVTFTAGGDGLPRASGTFEATLPSDGGATTLTEGKFDVPVNQTGG